MKLLYVGKGNALINGPARDLKELDIDELAMLYTVDELIASGLYTYEIKLDLQFEHDSIATAKRVPVTADNPLTLAKPKTKKSAKAGE